MNAAPAAPAFPARGLPKPYGPGDAQARAPLDADLATRRALYSRFMLSQSVYQTGPWAELAMRPADWAAIADLTLRAAE